VGGAGAHHEHLLAVAQLPVDDPDIGDDAAIGVVDRVEDQRAGRTVVAPLRCRHRLDDGVEQLGDAVAGLRGDPQHLGGVAADDPGDLLGVLVGFGSGQIDLVEHRDDLEIGLQGQIQVRQGLGLDALGGVHQQHRPLAGLQGALHLVGEVDMSGGVDHIEDVVPPAGAPGHPDRLGLDGDAALALDVHPIQVLGAGAALVEHPGQLQHPVGQGGLAVVDMGDDAEVADRRRVGRPGLRHILGGGRGHLLPRRLGFGGLGPVSHGCRVILPPGGAAGIVFSRALCGRVPGSSTRIRGCPVPNIKSQVKRVKTNEKARQRNKAVKSALRTHVRNFRQAAEAGDQEKALTYAKIANRQLDKAVSKGVIHKNQAANRKSAISKKLDSLAA
jgi:small subunit ribosomal protein S20